MNLTLGSPSPLVNQTLALPGALQWEKADTHFHRKIHAKMDAKMHGEMHAKMQGKMHATIHATLHVNVLVNSERLALPRLALR